MECELFTKLYGLDTVSLRYYNVYSEDQEFNGPYSTVINHWMNSIKNKQPLFLDGDGEQTRDFVHVDDVVAANIFCMTAQKNFDGSILDVGVGKETSLKYIKFYIDQENDVSWVKRPQRVGDVRDSKSDPSKLKRLVGNLKSQSKRFKNVLQGVKKMKDHKLSNQAVGAIMMALQKSLMEQTDIVPVLREFKIQVDDSGELVVMNPPKVEVKEKPSVVLEGPL